MRKAVVKLLSQSFLPIQGRYPRIRGEALSLRDMGCEVLILGWDRIGNCNKKECMDGVRIERVTIKSSEMRGPVQIFFLLSFWIKAFFRLLFEKIDVIHCHNLDVVPLGYVLSKVKRCSVIFDAHEPNYYALWPEKWQKLLRIVNAIESFLAKRMDAIIVTNEFQLNKFSNMGIKSVEVIGNYPVDDFIINNLLSEKFQKDKVVFGRIGTIYHDVGIEETADAFKGIIHRHKDTELLLAGRVVESYRKDLMDAIGLIDNGVKLTGSYSAEEMPDLYNQIDVSLMIYRKTNWFKEITPTKFFDSLAHGVPVIMTDIGGLGKIVEKYQCGIIVEENDIEGIQNAMEQLILDKKLRKEMAENGLKLIKEDFNWKNMEGRLKGIYESL